MGKKQVAVVMSGCGFLDGAEIQEAVSTLIAIDRAGADYQVFAPNKPQLHVVDHLAGSPTAETRNVMQEAARIARGNVKALSDLRMKDWDALIVVGGFGAAKNLVDYAIKGTACSIDVDIERALKEAHGAKKPIGAMCIAPVIVARALGAEVHATVTIGTDAATAADLGVLGAKHENAKPCEVVVDEPNRIVSTPAYMTAERVSQVFEGISRLVERVLSMT